MNMKGRGLQGGCGRKGEYLEAAKGNEGSAGNAGMQERVPATKTVAPVLAHSRSMASKFNYPPHRGVLVVFLRLDWAERGIQETREWKRAKHPRRGMLVVVLRLG